MLIDRMSPDRPLPFLWEGLLGPATQEDTIPAVVGAVATLLACTPRGDDEDRRLVRGLVAVDAPYADRVWLTAQRQGREVRLREVVASIERSGWSIERDGLAPWCDAMRPDFVGAFDLDTVEFWERCLPPYHGFLHAWTDEHTARAHYKTWPRERQAAFEHEYLLYAENDRSFAARHGGEPDAELQAAATWLRSQRRYVLRWTIVLRDEPLERPDWLRTLEPTLHEHAQVLRASLPQTPWDAGLVQMLDDAIVPLSTPTEPRPWREVLQRLEYSEGRIRVLELLHRLRNVVDCIGGRDEPELARARRVLSAHLDDALRWYW